MAEGDKGASDVDKGSEAGGSGDVDGCIAEASILDDAAGASYSHKMGTAGAYWYKWSVSPADEGDSASAKALADVASVVL